jgi:hypothetical protein
MNAWQQQAFGRSHDRVKGHSNDAICHDLRDSGATPGIPTKRNGKIQSTGNKSL